MSEMRIFRIYRLDPSGRVLSGDWLYAPSETAARIKAEALCQPGTSGLELWEGSRRVVRYDCDPEGPRPRTA